MALHISTSLGGVYPNTTGVYINNPMYPSAEDEPAYVGTCTCGDDVYTITQGRYMGSTGFYVQLGAGTPQFHQTYNGFSKVGFYATNNDGVVKVYYINVTNTDYVDGETDIVQSSTSGYNYNAYLLGTYTEDILEREWEDTPTPDNADPFGNFGGDTADTQPFGRNDNFNELDWRDDLAQGNDYGKFITAYELMSSDVQRIGSGLFLTNFWQALWNKFNGLSDPLSMILQAVELPVVHSNNLASAVFKLGGTTVEDDNNDPISCFRLTRRYDRYTFGFITLKETWGTAKDYSDTSVSIYLPYVGVKELDPDIVIGTKLSLYVDIDRWTGDILYTLFNDNADVSGKYYRQAGVVYRWSGNCAFKVPLGRVDNSGSIMNLAMGLGALGAGVMTGGASVAAEGAVISAGTSAGLTASGVGALTGFAQNGFKPLVQSSGGISGAVGAMDIQYPYLIIKRAVPQYPVNWRSLMGAPKFQSYKGSELSGYTLYGDIKLEGMEGASYEEIEELKRILCTEGVIL